MNKLIQLASHFAVEGVIARVKPLGEGFINDTYTVTLEGQDQPSYILQRKNHIVFRDDGQHRPGHALHQVQGA